MSRSSMHPTILRSDLHMLVYVTYTLKGDQSGCHRGRHVRPFTLQVPVESISQRAQSGSLLIRLFYFMWGGEKVSTTKEVFLLHIIFKAASASTLI